MVRKRVLVEGQVQGVGYRVACAQRARAAGVGGTVRNLPDGRVEAVFEGSATSVDTLIDWCGQGPTYAQVRRVEVVEEAPTGERGFRVA